MVRRAANQIAQFVGIFTRQPRSIWLSVIWKHRPNEVTLAGHWRVWSDWPAHVLSGPLIGRHRSQLPVKWAGDTIYSAASFMGYRSVIPGHPRWPPGEIWLSRYRGGRLSEVRSPFFAPGWKGLYFWRWRGSKENPRYFVEPSASRKWTSRKWQLNCIFHPHSPVNKRTGRLLSVTWNVS